MKGWGWILGLGVLTIALGVFALGNAVAASIAVTVFTGICFLLGGGLQLVMGFSIESVGGKILSILLGLLMIALGWSFLAHPLQGVLSLTFLIVILLASGGVLRLIYAWRMRDSGFFWSMLISGAVSILLAMFILSTFNLSGVEAGDEGLTAEAFKPVLSVLGLILGIELIFNGIGMVVISLFLRSVETTEDKE
ncbi:MAG: DUF308 domain-containing protein [Rhodobacteraceae bacterium]|nr:DUF308 domain-containing protein [Paracoccaceae bacterium]